LFSSIQGFKKNREELFYMENGGSEKCVVAGCAGSQRLSLRYLSSKEKRFRILSRAADFEGPEVLVPFSFRHAGAGLDPEAKLIQRWEIVPRRDLRHASPKDHTAHLVAESFGFLGIGSGAKTFGKL
jgi:hypothetical protein